MTLDLLDCLPRQAASAAEAALPSVFDQLAGTLHHSTDNNDGKKGAEAKTPKKRRSRCVWTENVDKPRLCKHGSKRHQRFLNVKFIMDMAEGEIEWNYAPNTHSGFKAVCENPQLIEQWSEFSHASEEQQARMLSRAHHIRPSLGTIKSHCRAIDSSAMTPEKCFNRLDRRLRLLYRKSHIPRGAVEAMEREMLALFQEDPDLVLVWKMDNGFFRGILHGICQYHNLRSSSQDRDGGRHTVIENPHEHFTPSPMPLYEFLDILHAEPGYVEA